jgi:Polysaccharide biosynthesis protein.
VQTIYHAAAYKHVPMVERNPGEAVWNNIFGTLHVAQAAIKADVETFVLISTDKAVRPTNTMGATKRFAELILQALSLNAVNNLRTRFTMVRFGNVLGSSGSVVPLFKEQIARGGPVTVTDERIIRYFMTIPEASQLVIQAGAMGHGGDVFVLDMGEPIRIVDLAKRMIHLSGLEIKDAEHPDGDIEISYTGLRPGEKLYEELLIGDNVSKTDHARIMRAQELVIPWAELEKMLATLEQATEDDDFERVRGVLADAVTGFIPQCEIEDVLWKEDRRLVNG